MIPMRDGVPAGTPKSIAAKDQTGSTAIPDESHAVWNRQRHLSLPRRPLTTALQAVARRRLHRRVPGHSRTLQIRRLVRGCWGRCVISPIRKRPTKAPTPGDTVDWLIKKRARQQRQSSASTGVSYGGWTSMMAGIDAPSRRRRRVAAGPRRSTPGIGDDFWRNGAFPPELRPSSTRARWNCRRRWSRFPFDETDSYAWYLKQGALKNFDNAQSSTARSRFWSEDDAAPDARRPIGAAATSRAKLRNVRVPVLSTAGLVGTRRISTARCRSAKDWDRTARWWSAHGRTASWNTAYAEK